MSNLIPKDGRKRYIFDLFRDLDKEVLSKPYGFYEFLGVERDASKEEIKRAYKKLARELHPDMEKGDERMFKVLQDIVDVLLNDDRRKQYDYFSLINSYFGTNNLIGEGTPTKIIGEFIWGMLEEERKDKEMSEKYPQYSFFKGVLKRRPPEKKEEILYELLRLEIMEEMGEEVPEETILIRLNERMKKIKEYNERLKNFVSSFKENLNEYWKKVWDINYVGNGKVIFGTRVSKMRFEILGYEDKGGVLELILTGNCYIVSSDRVHFKAKNAEVKINNPKIKKGIFHIIDGDVIANIFSPDESVIVKAPKINASRFEKKEELGKDVYVPKVEDPPENYVSRLEIAVLEGHVDLIFMTPELKVMQRLQQNRGDDFESIYKTIKYMNTIEKI